eukprot:SAG31_NODE_550_length_14214_cov_3.054269_12_plen_207_part_01
MLQLTLQNAFFPVASFVIMASVVFVGCAQAFHMSFGSELLQYSTLFDSLMTLVAMLLGHFDLPALQRVGPLLFVVFILLVGFVLLNMFVAILSESYAKVRIFSYRLSRPLTLSTLRRLESEFLAITLLLVTNNGLVASPFLAILRSRSRGCSTLFSLSLVALCAAIVHQHLLAVVAVCMPRWMQKEMIPKTKTTMKRSSNCQHSPKW